MEVAKVNLLHSATTGYAPLIFNLDATCDYQKFLEKCQVVWKELSADHRLPQKLVRFRIYSCFSLSELNFQNITIIFSSP